MPGRECPLQGMQILASCKSLNGGKAVSIRLHRKDSARSDRLAVPQHRAAATDTVLAPDVGAREPKFKANKVGEQDSRLDISLMSHTVNGDSDPHAASSLVSADVNARRSISATILLRYSTVA